MADRKFLEIDVDNFDDRLKTMKPRVAFHVPNTLTGEGNMAVDITFESMDDFSPGRGGAQGRAAAASCSRRATQLSNLLTYMDGKNGAEELITKLLHDPALLQSLAAAAKPEDGRSRRLTQDERGVEPWPSSTSEASRSGRRRDRPRSTISSRS